MQRKMQSPFHLTQSQQAIHLAVKTRTIGRRLTHLAIWGGGLILLLALGRVESVESIRNRQQILMTFVIETTAEGFDCYDVYCWEWWTSEGNFTDETFGTGTWSQSGTFYYVWGFPAGAYNEVTLAFDTDGSTLNLVGYSELDYFDFYATGGTGRFANVIWGRIEVELNESGDGGTAKGYLSIREKLNVYGKN